MTSHNIIRWATIVAVVLVAIVAGWVSYLHAFAVVAAHGQSGLLGHLYPGTVDGLIFSSSMVLLDSAQRDVKAPRLARWLLAAGIGATLAANVLAGVAFGVLGGVVAAWPAFALVGSYELLMMLVRRARTTTPEATTEAVSTLPEVETEVVPIPAPEPVAQAVAEAAPPTDVPPATSEAKKTVATRAPRLPLEKHVRRATKLYRPHVVAGQLPSKRTVMSDLGVGADRADSVLAHLASISTTEVVTSDV